jgi:DNA repair exonuclease SbcCD nuclease subunit
MLRLLHFADLHLDRAFAGQSYSGCDGAQRRTLLRSALEEMVDLALEGNADAVTIAGDLFENEHVTPDTAAFIARQLGRLSCPVVLASGNHDHSSPTSPYITATWPPNVTLALEPKPTRVQVAEVVIWAAGYGGREMDPAVLHSFDVPRGDGRTHLLVIHGVDLSSLGADLNWGGLGLRAEEVRAAGFDHALLGHIHQGAMGDLMSWPGSPVALDAAEAPGKHGLLWVEVEAGIVRVEAVPANVVSYQTISVDVSEVSDSTELEGVMRQALEPISAADALVTCRLWGSRGRSLDFDRNVLEAALQHLTRGIRVVDATVAEIDLRDLAHEPNARGAAISRLLADGSAPALWAATLVAEAFEGDIRVPA